MSALDAVTRSPHVTLALFAIVAFIVLAAVRATRRF